MDSSRIRAFWDAQARKAASLRTEGIANLEEDPELLESKVRLEEERIMPMVKALRPKAVLDLGAGVGQWAFRFAGIAREVHAVEYSAPMLALAADAKRAGSFNNVELYCEPAQSFRSSRHFDLVFISGVLIYLHDQEFHALLANMSTYCHDDTVVLLRDGTGTTARYEIDSRWSEGLQTFYSATYRTRGEYIQAFEQHGFTCTDDEDMFEEGSPLNKWQETRLRLYAFRVASRARVDVRKQPQD